MSNFFQNRKLRRPITLLIILLLLAGAAYCLIRSGILPVQPDERAESLPAPTPTTAEPESELTPQGRLAITPEREQYQSGDLQLIIPKLNIDASVWNGTTEEDLKHGACLYDYAQLPGEGDQNVSIAAHRNGIRNGQPNDNALFYYIDTLKPGDYLYLSDQEQIYRYRYKDTIVVEEDDWRPIYRQGYSCLTLTSCTPIGISDHRIIVRGELDQIFPRSAEFIFTPASQSN